MASSAEAAAPKCDICQEQAATLFCRNDNANLCHACDKQVHGRNAIAAQHFRVSLCELCERVPATLYCKQARKTPLSRSRDSVAEAATQDAASLCEACSREIHTANPLAARHEIITVQGLANPLAAPSVIKGTRVAPSANAAELEEYRRRCEDILREGEEGDDGGGGDAAHAPLPPGPSGAALAERPSAPPRPDAGRAASRPPPAALTPDSFEDLFDGLAELDPSGMDFSFMQSYGTCLGALLPPRGTSSAAKKRQD